MCESRNGSQDDRECGSLIPRLSHDLVSYCLQYAKTDGGGRPGPFYHVNDDSVYIGRQWGRRSPAKKNELESLSCSFCPKRWSVESLCEVKKVLLLVENKERVFEMCSFDWDSPPQC